MNQNLPDLGSIGQPQQVQVMPAVLAQQMLGLPTGLLDGTSLIELMRVMVREEIHAALINAGLFKPASEYEQPAVPI